MLKPITKIIGKIFGTKADRDIKDLRPYVLKTNIEYEKLTSLTHDQLRAQTQELKEIIQNRLHSFDEKITELHTKAQHEDTHIDEQEAIFKEIDQLESDRNTELELVLLEILPRAFAVVKETAHRFKENSVLEVTATTNDYEVAAVKSNVKITGEKALWSNQWQAAGTTLTWDMLHYDVQIIGGVVLHQGKIAEMATGEGKTLVATFPAYLNALGGRGVHIITVNDYLAKRDSEWMAPLFEFHGLTIDCIDKHQPHSEARKKAYRADIIYGTNNEFGFDYLRDNMATKPEEQVQRYRHFAMVDEVDSVLVDEARTPLIISGPMAKGDEHEFFDLKPRIARLVEVQKKLAQDLLLEAKKLIASPKKEDREKGSLALFRAHRALPKNKPLIKFLSETGMKAILQSTENIYLAENKKRMPEADKELYFTIEEKNNSVDLTEKGIDFITQSGEDTTFFVIPDMATELANIDKNISDEKEKILTKEKLILDYSHKAQRIHTVQQLLKAYTLFEKNVEYVLVEEEGEQKIKIVDEQTGRIMEGRRYSDGLHQAIEAKENVQIEDATQTYATITLQNYFRMYHKLSGMTGTAETEAGEFWQIYKLDVVVIPTNKKITRKDEEDKVYKTLREKYNAAVDEINELVAKGRPVLVGTTSVENSEVLSRMLNLRKIPHQVLNAKQHQKEAQIVADAGNPGTVTIATNMAGRGTDIKLTPASRESGGLAIIGTERHESRRVDRQLRGRSGRQGDPGSSQFFVSLEDNLMRIFGSERIVGVMDKLGMKEGEVIQHSMVTGSIERSQKKVEENNFGMRKRLLEYDDVMNYQRNAIYKRRQNGLFGDRLAIDIANTFYDVAEEIITNTQSYEELTIRTIEWLTCEVPFTKEEFGSLKPEQKIKKLYEKAENQYNTKNQEVIQTILAELNKVQQNFSRVAFPVTDGEKYIFVEVDFEKLRETKGREFVKEMEKNIVLTTIDQEWKEHLKDMDDLKQSVQNAVFEQKDPLLIYKFEAVELFKKFLGRINRDTLQFLTRASLPEEITMNVPRQSTKKTSALKTKKQEISSSLGSSQMEQENEEDAVREKQTPTRVIKIADRNQRVTVQYPDGTRKENVKYKAVEQDVESGKAVVIA